jgi:hypothetical protein
MGPCRLADDEERAMTAKRDLKKRARERQARTGERYTTALAEVLAERPERPGQVPVLELIELTAEAAALGLRCRAAMFPDIAARVDGAGVLARLRDALVVTRDDRRMQVIRSVLLDGAPLAAPARPSLEVVADVRAFRDRVRAGLAGVSDSGTMLALNVEGRHDGRVELVVCRLCAPPPVPGGPRDPLLLVGSLASSFSDKEIGVLLWMGRLR